MSDQVLYSIDDAFEQLPHTQSPGQPASETSPLSSGTFHRYHIETRTAPDIVPFPSRFRVRVKKHGLVGMLLKELVEYKGNFQVALSRPCVYGVFSRPVGGLAPREELCVGCLRCTVQYPNIVQIYPNPERQRLGDSFVKPEYVDTIVYEARDGRVPVRGAGYRGAFGGEGWDGLWTDMSEIVRPTRDGIHGREFISTAVDIGEKPAFLHVDERGEVIGPLPTVITTQVPFLFDVPAYTAQSRSLLPILSEAARQIETLAVVPIQSVVELSLAGAHVVPVIAPELLSWLDRLSWSPRMIMLDGWDHECYDTLRRRYPDSIVCVRVPMDTNLVELAQQGVRVFHLAANFHGYVGDRFVMDLILQAHQSLVDAGVREEVTLIGAGGIVLAEHVPKAIICGLDAVALDVALAVALQARFSGECIDRKTASLFLPRLNTDWGVQRLMNLAASWRDQLLEVMGAMGLREVRRLRGEVGRCMFQKDLEREIFAELGSGI
ncbi:MAG TPA: glutamate synthase-related protein [Ktedonobacteraceae bacterium]